MADWRGLNCKSMVKWVNRPYRCGLLFFLVVSWSTVSCNHRYETEYQQLEKHLISNNLRQADQLTKELLYAIGEKRTGGLFSPNGYFSRVKFESFPCEDLNRIEQLWNSHSQGRFGFTVQKQLYFETGNTLDGPHDHETYHAFQERVGWLKDGKILLYYQLPLNNSAPVGHLPVMNTNESGFRGPLFKRLEECDQYRDHSTE